MVADRPDPVFEKTSLQAHYAYRLAEMRVREVKHRLRELIVALDRRVPRAGNAAEADIARDAALMRERAVLRLAEITPPTAPMPSGSSRVD